LVGVATMLAYLLGDCAVHETGPVRTGESHPSAATIPSKQATPSAPSPSASALAGEIPHAQWGTLISPPPPLAPYAAYLDGPAPTAEEQAAAVERDQQVQEAIAACMAARGFHWMPHPAAPALNPRGWIASSFLLWLNVPFLDQDRAVVARNGYGVMGTPLDEAGGWADDPNATYLESLGPAEAEAYSIALNGDYRVPTTEGSCSRQPIEAFPSPESHANRVEAFDAEYGDLRRLAMDVIRDHFGDDPRVVGLNRQ
jgi:hypothetical protein